MLKKIIKIYLKNVTLSIESTEVFINISEKDLEKDCYNNDKDISVGGLNIFLQCLEAEARLLKAVMKT